MAHEMKITGGGTASALDSLERWLRAEQRNEPWVAAAKRRLRAYERQNGGGSLGTGPDAERWRRLELLELVAS